MASSDVLLLAPGDNVAVAIRALAAGAIVTIGDARVNVERAVGVGHKIAARAIAAGEPIVKYGCPIGRATRAIAPGDYVHTHNVASDYLPTYTLPG